MLSFFCNLELNKDELALEEIKNGRNSNFYTIPIKYLVACTNINEQKNTIRIIIAEEKELNAVTYRHLDFEGNPKIIDDLKTAISHLIEYCISQYRKNYQVLANKTMTKWSRSEYKERNQIINFF
ncbi:unnamed protein product [Brachionus calyciflorus]|uniref:Uncharacterized protein n=1 Tax=Brachionus calyciflorus TaxID=104777 RepID=A0A813SNV7_9BILA|nr:unnamed protein product [Brachionus calyciflorus]